MKKTLDKGVSLIFALEKNVSRKKIQLEKILFESNGRGVSFLFSVISMKRVGRNLNIQM